MNTARPDAPRYVVRVTGQRDSGRWIEFEFSAGDPDLTVELVLSPEQFDEFCRTHHIERH